MGTARRSSEACLKPWSRTKSSRCRAVYHPHAVSNRHPQRCPPLPGIDTTIGGSDFRTPPPVSSPFKLVHGCPHPADRDTDLLGYRAFSMSGSIWPRTPGSTGTARRGAVPVVACRRDKSVGTHPPNFSGLNTFKVGSTRSLYTSPAFAPTHRHARYRSRRKARYWARGSRLPRWDFHPLDYATLPSRTVPYYSSLLFLPIYSFIAVGIPRGLYTICRLLLPSIAFVRLE